MLIGIMGDLHAQIWKGFNRILPDGRSSRLKECLDAMDYCLDRCSCMGASVLVDLGDSLNVKNGLISIQALCGLQEVRAKYDHIDQILLKGNHEGSVSNPEHGLDAFQPLKNCMVVDACKVLTINDIELVMVPYGPEEAVEFLGSLPARNAEKRYIFMHHGINGAEIGSDILLDIGDALDLKFLDTLDFDYLFAGHYHKYQQLTDRIYIVGSPLQHTFGEAGNSNRMVVLDTANGELTHLHVPTSKEFHIIEVSDYDDLDDLPEDGYLEFRMQVSNRELESAVTNLREKKYSLSTMTTIKEETKEALSINVRLEKEKIIQEYTVLRDQEIKQKGLDKDTLLKIGMEILQSN